ncbi:thiopurine S-methyltransferase [Alcanivorax sp.]|uniref:thiopurine S-methyltransferase n=1 Tax=Alcanivorax sp. TaxID=1872427 RepID=UPI0025C219C6|nr:thiopurine S-methyltransferase [Alcanivorax sp.]
MEPDFWQEKWQKNEIGFHLSQIHPLLKRYWSQLGPASTGRVFVPLCGKTLDMHYLREQGADVVGAELAEHAVIAFFEEAGLDPAVSDWHGGKCYRTEGITLFQGDIFTLDQSTLGPIDAVYDRAAVIALPPALRQQYALHLINLAGNAAQLLITLSYDQSAMAGPPFSVDADNVKDLYGRHYDLNCLSSKNIIEHEPRFRERGLSTLTESCWQLTPK